MGVDLICIMIAAITSILLFRSNLKIKMLEKRIDQLNEKSPEEFSLGLRRLNSEFTSSVVLDTLTKLPGRQAFDDRLEQAIHQSKRFEKAFALVLLDINEFHIINKVQGHEKGDKLLINVAKRLQGCIRQIDTMTRYAGDTFLFLLPQLSQPETAVYVAQRLLDNMVLPFQIDDENLFITASLGVAIFPNDGTDAKTLFKNATSALNQAKIYGKGRYQFYHQELHALGQRELAMHAVISMPDFLQKLFVEYRPYIDVKKDKIIYVQAMPCFTIPDLGTVTFTEFSRIAENCGKISEVGQWILKSTALQLQTWLESGFSPDKIIINVTLREIENPTFIYTTSRLLEEFNISPDRIIFEIAGENLFTNTGSLGKIFSMLSHLGIQIALTVSTLGNLAIQKITELPVNYLKIDGKFFDEKTHKDNELILHMIVELAKEMNINIIAEEVNTDKEKQSLQAVDCSIMQGNIFKNYTITTTGH